MIYLMKAELYKFKKDISVWIISFILICCAGISIFTEVYSSAENTVLNLGKESMTLILACAIYVGFSCTDDFTNRTVIYAITYGNRRLQILVYKILPLYLWLYHYHNYIYVCFSNDFFFGTGNRYYLTLSIYVRCKESISLLAIILGNCYDFLFLCDNNKKINYGNGYFSCVFHCRSSVH